MKATRILTLVLGPIGIIVAAHAIAMPNWSEALSVSEPLASGLAAATTLSPDSAESLSESCERVGKRLEERLGNSFEVVVHPPFVIAGDRSADQLEAYYRDIIQPVARALWTSYFDRQPDQPISIVLLSDEQAFRQQARNLDSREGGAYYGYFLREDRRLVVNLSTGDGTLAHELTHALSLYDFPDMPEWFDEGLAALHEESDFSEDGLQLKGLHNWRLTLLREALQRKHAPSLVWLVRNHSFRGEGEGLNYALVRYFCMYLQHRDLLTHFYRKFRSNVARDPEGLQTLMALLDVESAADIERDFYKWLLEIAPRAGT